MKTSYLVIALVLLVVVLGLSYYYSVRPEKEEVQQKTVIEEIEETPIAKAAEKTEVVAPIEEVEIPKAAIIH